MKNRSDSGELLITLAYLAFGLMVYVLFFTPESGFSWADPWVFIIAVFWPIALIFKFVWLILVLIAATAIYYAVKRRLRNRSDDDARETNQP